MTNHLNQDSGIHHILGSEELISLFEHTPSFDDAEVVDMHFNRGNTLDCAKSNNWRNHQVPFLQVQFYLFDNYYSCEDPRASACYITIEFLDIQEFSLSRFEHQNPICDFNITESFVERLNKNMFGVNWGGAGHEVDFLCAEIRYLGTLNK